MSKSDYDNFRNVVEEIIKQFEKRPVKENRFYQRSIDKYAGEAIDLHAYAFFLQEVYSFRFILIIVGYIKRHRLEWINDYLQRGPHETIYRKLEMLGRYDAPEFTNLLLEIDCARDKGQKGALRSSLSIPLLNVKRKDGYIEIHVVERPEIEKGFKSIINYT